MAQMKIWYDQEGDFLELVFENAPATLEQVADDVYERRTPDGRVIGVAVFNFSRYDRSDLALPLTVRAVSAA